MYLRDLAVSLRRMWLLVLIGLLATSGVCVGLWSVVPASWVARTSLVMLPPPSVVGEGGNPYLYLGGLGQAVDILTRRLNADAISNPVKREYPNTTFTVASDASTSGPIIVVEAIAGSRTVARAVMNTVVDSAEPALDSLQSNLSVPTKSRITVSAFAVDQDPRPDLKARIQAVGAAGALGIMLTLLLAVFVDGRRAAKRPDGSHDRDVPPGGVSMRKGNPSRSSARRVENSTLAMDRLSARVLGWRVLASRSLTQRSLTQRLPA